MFKLYMFVDANHNESQQVMQVGAQDFCSKF